MDVITFFIKDNLPALVDLYSIQYSNLPNQCKDSDINSTYELLVFFKENPTYAKDSWSYNQDDNKIIKAIALSSFDEKYKEMESIFSEASDINCPEKRLLEIARKGIAIKELWKNPSTTKRVLLEIIQLPEKRITAKRMPNKRMVAILRGSLMRWAKPYLKLGWEETGTTGKDKDELGEVRISKNQILIYMTLRFPPKKIILEHPSCDLDIVKKLAQDEDKYVRMAVTKNPNMPSDEEE